MDRLQIYKLFGILFLLEFSIAGTVPHHETSTNMNEATTMGRVSATNQREEIDFGNPFESPSEMPKPPDLSKESNQLINDLDPGILAELDRTKAPVQRIFIDKNGFNHNTIYKRNPLDGSISKLQTGSILLDELQKQGTFIPGVGAVPLEELLRTNGSVNKNFVDGDVQQRAVFRLLVPKGGEAVRESEPNETKSSDTTQVTRTTTTTTTPRPTQIAETTTPSTIEEPVEPNNVNTNNIRDVVLPNFNGFFENPSTKTYTTDDAPVLRRWYTDSDHFFNSAFSDIGGSIGSARPSMNWFNINKNRFNGVPTADRPTSTLSGNENSDDTPTVSISGSFVPIKESYISPDGKVRITTWRWQPRAQSVDRLNTDRALNNANSNPAQGSNTRFDRMPTTYNRRSEQ